MSEPYEHNDIIDVVVPLYNNYADAARLFACLESAVNRARFDLIVVDDASTETSPLALPKTGGQIGRVSFIRNVENIGFAASVNIAMRSSRRDVVLLNSDTLVYDGWLDRIKAAAGFDDKIGSVTPLSNAATIFSYPTFPDEFDGVLEIDWEHLDRLCGTIDSDPVEAPTAVGFCMLIKRVCLDAVGLFDEVTFRSGYGEESDFCRRAVAAGWINVAAPNIFVWHRGQGSFGGRANSLRTKAEEILRGRHRDYRNAVAHFIKRDPLLNVRLRLDCLRINQDARELRLYLSSADGFTSTTGLKAMSFARRKRRLWQPVIDGFAPLPNLPSFSGFSRLDTIRRFLAGAGVSEVVVCSRSGLPSWMVVKFKRAAMSLDLPVTRFDHRLSDQTNRDYLGHVQAL